jgi:ABC-2 type transport system ATP-binding protein
MKQRLGIALSLIGNPDLYIRDEPMNGLDPLGRILIKKLMKNLQQSGKSILFSTHILSDVEEVADQFSVLHDGHIVFQ